MNNTCIEATFEAIAATLAKIDETAGADFARRLKPILEKAIEYNWRTDAEALQRMIDTSERRD